jgi:hypothetical protein
MEHGQQTTTWIGKNNVMETKTFENNKLLAIVQCHSKFSFEWN